MALVTFDIQSATRTPQGTRFFIDVLLRTEQGEKRISQTNQVLDVHGSRMYWLRDVSRRLKMEGIEIAPEALDMQLLETLQTYKAEHLGIGKEDLDGNDPMETTPPEILQAAEDLLLDPHLVQRLRDDIEYLGVAGEANAALAIYLILTSRLLDKPLAGVVLGVSSSGKSHLLNTIVSMMPPEVIEQAHTITPEALYYMPPGSLRHKAIVAGERVQRSGEAEAAAKWLREGLSDGRLVKLVPRRDRQTGEMVTERIVQEGPWSYVESTTASSIGEETSSRMLSLFSDESPEQTAKVIDLMRREAAGSFSPIRRQRIQAIHRCAQRLLEPVPVMIPWAPYLRLPEGRPATRRAFGHLLGLIRTIALLRQRQHPYLDGPDGPCIHADATDYAIAYDLAIGLFAAQYDRLSPQVRQLLQALRARFAVGEEFGLQNVAEACIDISEKQLRRRLDVLVDHGLLRCSKKQRPYTYGLTGQDLARPDLGLPDPQTIAEVIRAGLAEGSTA